MKFDRAGVRYLLLLWIASSVLFVMGCAAESDASAEAPRFADIYPLFEESCGGGKSGCHITGMSAGLAMPDAQLAFEHIVETDSGKCEGMAIVAPGNADESVLMIALQGGSDCVKAMPLGRDPMSADDIDLIREWIDSGALAD